MATPFKKDELVTIERRTGATDPDYNTQLDAWETVAGNVWANVQDVLPSRAEQTSNRVRVATKQTRLRIQSDIAVSPDMRVKLHGRGDIVMQIVAGPALMDDRMHNEFMLEGYST
ncbi:head-tail adaptor protein [Duganella sp. FT92W]|uniref:Head-tail adaptor protein n=1 Tax=Pseudoduganella rivuli TaxID=2666085 RepID=A0A7X2IM63_9BURK|nr:head-tail adaptor protein [Pseudoduganella rivuli]MRV72567.1 head-tail adaptor protein [Pseudoduganella rivuli]